MEYTKNILKHPKIEIGDYTYGIPIIHAFNWPAKVKIGKFCSIAGGVEIYLDNYHRTDWISTYPFMANEDFPESANITGHPYGKGDVIIGNDVWIGNNALILSGVTIGDGAVIGSKAVVTKSVEPYSIVVGNPGRVVRYRFSPEKIERLIEIKWWDWPIEKIRKMTPLLCSDLIDEFLKKCNNDIG